MKHHLTRKEARLANALALSLAMASNALKHSLHADAVNDGKAKRKRDGKPRKRAAPKWQGFACPKHSAIREERPNVTAHKAAELEVIARAHFNP